MLRITPDTNILISATISGGNEYELLKLAKLGKIKLVLSLPILKEFFEVISRTKFSFSAKIIDEILANIISISDIVFPREKLDIIKDDPSDNMVLECALAGNSDYIISGDNHLLSLKKFKNIRIVRSVDILRFIKY